jgi:AcrR family transcriptional regulator
MAVTDIEHNTDVSGCHHGMMGGMSRWKPDAAGRLEQAAYELFLERGYDRTTVADIAARA